MGDTSDLCEKREDVGVPSIEAVETERKRLRRGKYYRRALRGTLSVLVVVAAIAVLVTTLFLPILQISGDSMSPTLEHDEIVVLFKTNSLKRGDLVAFYYQGKILLKRVIALPEETVVIDGKGNVYVNEQMLEEPYVLEKSLGDCDLQFPYVVPAASYFVLGDQRTNSVDSRNSVIGTIKIEDIIGKIFVRVWPMSRIGFVN
ncbi:MAG: signal peptidase I [Ruminococcaceae bacterium]|nr:signal peptidase I [Oscillospiraceae bacterium]